ncbi:hypothetical protein [Catelliglobosispora koreensis]|uniref:hypothetical protein n=1 Tax=Catelliglobosispora koreensis TaxID=129052 RepID=UPI00035D39B8|nr:hypothetical protein [Catelliglobosispora koreensis]
MSKIGSERFWSSPGSLDETDWPAATDPDLVDPAEKEQEQAKDKEASSAETED